MIDASKPFLFEFSPPYGDGTMRDNNISVSEPFSPPYGDSTSSTSTISSVQTGFRPLTGMVLRFDNGVEFRDRFSSPYGDGTKMAMENQFVYKFSPPYGDGTIIAKSASVVSAFSPPYGDSTGIRPLFAGGALVFAPLRGWYLTYVRFLLAEHCFRPLTGMVLPCPA